MKNKIRIILWSIVVIFLIVLAIAFKKTYALFERNASGVVNSAIAKWIIELSDNVITSGLNEDLDIDNFVYESSNTVESGYIAPGTSAYFDLVFDATRCDVAVKYDINFRMNEIDYADNISFQISELNGNNSIRTAPNTYSGVITLDQIDDEELVTLRVSILWDDVLAHDEDDTELGIVEDNTLSIPISVSAVQYLGETLVEYHEPVVEQGES